jgi:hypothetical protein
MNGVGVGQGFRGRQHVMNTVQLGDIRASDDRLVAAVSAH